MYPVARISQRRNCRIGTSTARSTAVGAAFVLVLSLNLGCDQREFDTAGNPSQFAAETQDERDTAVLLVSHGSHSPQWRETLLSVEDEVRDNVLEFEQIGAVQSAFMEYSESSIASRLKEFGKLGYKNVVIVPLLLTVSSHSLVDIPTIAGLKEDRMTTETLRLERVEIYKAVDGS